MDDTDRLVSREICASSDNPEQVIIYDYAIIKTAKVDTERKTIGGCKRCCAKLSGSLGILQLITLIAFITYKNCTTVFVFGNGFLTKMPKNFECYDHQTEMWKPCTRNEICSQGISKEDYRPVEDDEYIDNWVSPNKLDLLCEPKYKIGLLGSMYFAGVVVTILFVPYISDKCCGRRNIFLIFFAIFDIGFLGLIISTNLIETYVFLFIMGACFAGRIVVGLTYLIEMLNPHISQRIIIIFFFSEPVLLILLTMWYQFIDRSWFAVFVITFVFIVIAFFWYLIWVPESPKWLYTFNQIGQAREVLKEIAEFNGVDEQTYKVKVLNKKFHKEMHPVEEATDATKIDDLPQGKYIKNVVVMTIIWTNSSFSMYTLNYMNKHFEGNIFLNYYLDGAAGIVGTLIAAPLYSLLKIRWSFFTTLVCINVFLVLFYIHQENFVSSKWIEAFG